MCIRDSGCGQHISQVKAQVPSGQWCNGKHTQAEKEAASAKSGGGFFARLFSSRRS